MSTVLFALKNSKLFGVDVGGLKYDGFLEPRPGGGYTLSVVYVIPPGASLITGASPPEEPLRVPLTTDLPLAFADGRILRLDTPLGPVNARFEKLRGMGALDE